MADAIKPKVVSQRWTFTGFSFKEWLKGIISLENLKKFIVRNAEILKLAASSLVGYSVSMEWYWQILAGLVSKGILDVVHYFSSE